MEFTVIAQNKTSSARVKRVVYGETIDSVIWDTWALLGASGYRLVSISRPIATPAREA